jgi:ATP-binding protein involved in chromosome partitioning
MADPRPEVISRRLAHVKRIIAVSSGKGGVGKSVIATTLALILNRRGFRVGLLDLDFTSPSTHLVLGVGDIRPEEEKGIIPPLVHGLRYMSIIYYSVDEPAPLRGTEISNAIIELLAITQWGKLDYLIVDMPPTISDTALDLIRLIRDVKFLLVTTPSIVAFETVRKLIILLRNLKVPILGVLENMLMNQTDSTRERALKLGVDYIGRICYDVELERTFGNVQRLLDSKFAAALDACTSELDRQFS